MLIIITIIQVMWLRLVSLVRGSPAISQSGAKPQGQYLDIDTVRVRGRH